MLSALFFLLVSFAALTTATSDVSDLHQLDCHRCSSSGRLAIEHLFQIDDRLYVQLKEASNAVYQTISLGGNTSGEQQQYHHVDLFSNDFSQVLGVLDFGPLNCSHCEGEPFEKLRNRVVVIGRIGSFPSKVTYKAYEKTVPANGSLSLLPLSSMDTVEVLKHSQLLSLPPPATLQSAIYLRQFGLTLATYRDNSTYLQLLHQPANPFMLRPIRIVDFLSTSMVQSGAFFWRDRLFVLSQTGVLSAILGSQILQKVISSSTDKLDVQPSKLSPFSRYSVEQFFQCNCSGAEDNFTRVQLNGINELFQLYMQMAEHQRDHKVASAPSTLDSNVLQKLLHSLKVSFYSELYRELLPSNDSQTSGHLKLRHLKSCLQSMLANESRNSDHYHGLELSLNRHFHSDTDFQLVPEGSLLGAGNESDSKLLNMTTLCLDATKTKQTQLGYFLVLTTFVVLGALTFCLALCCGVLNDDDATNPSDLTIIKGVGTELLRQVYRHPVRREDLVYLVEPYQEAPRKSGSLRTTASRISRSTTDSVPTPKNQKPTPKINSKVAVQKSEHVQVQSIKTNFELPERSSSNNSLKTQNSRASIPFDIRTSVNQDGSLLKIGASKSLPRVKLQEQVAASRKSRMSGKSTVKMAKQKSKLTVKGKSGR